MLGLRDAEAEDRRRRAGVASSRAIRSGVELTACVSAGDPGAADAIGVGLRQAGDPRAASRPACWRRRSAPARSRPAPSRGERLRLERGNVGDQQAVGARLGRVAHEAGPRDDEIGVSQDADRHVRMALRGSPRSGRSSRRPDAGGERALRRGLDHRAVGDRVGEGDADLDHVGAALDDRVEQLRAGLADRDRRASGRRRTRLRRPAARTWRRSGSCESAACAWATSLSPRPDRPTRIALSGSLLGELQRMGERVRGFERAEDALALPPAP